MERTSRARRIFALVTSAVLVLPVLLAFLRTSPAAAASKIVIERGVEFVPKLVGISVGDTVVWRYESGGSHTVTFEDQDLHPACTALVGAGCQTSGNPTAQRTFNKAGHYPYHCKIHEGMAGVVDVTAEATTTTLGSAATTAPKSTSSTTATTAPTSSTTVTTRRLSTSSTMAASTTTFGQPTTTIAPNDAPAFDPGGDDSGGGDPGEDSSETTATAEAKGQTDDGEGSAGTVTLIIGLLVAVSAGGGFLLWRFRPGRGS